MKALLAITILAGTTVAASAQYSNNGYGGYGTGSNSNSHFVQPHVNSNGSYVGGYHATNPNSTTLDNYGTRGNSNPWTGQTGHRSGGSSSSDD